MKNYLIAAFLFAAIFGGMLLSVGCQPLAVSQVTVEVNDTRSLDSCEMSVNVDGNQAISVMGGQLIVPFPNPVTPGVTHNMNFFMPGNATCESTQCSFQSSGTVPAGAVSYTLPFSAGGGDVFEANVSNGVSCYNTVITPST